MFGCFQCGSSIQFYSRPYLCRPDHLSKAYNEKIFPTQVKGESDMFRSYSALVPKNSCSIKYTVTDKLLQLWFQPELQDRREELPLKQVCSLQLPFPSPESFLILKKTQNMFLLLCWPFSVVEPIVVLISVCNKQRPRLSLLCHRFRLIQTDNDDDGNFS